MKIAVVGTGYVGLVTGAGFSDFGHYVTCVDIDPKRVASLQRNEIPFFEPGLAEFVRRNVSLGRLHFSSSTSEAVAGATVSGYDPEAMNNIRAQLGDVIVLAADPYSAANGADAVVLFDGRNVWSRSGACTAGAPPPRSHTSRLHQAIRASAGAPSSASPSRRAPLLVISQSRRASQHLTTPVPFRERIIASSRRLRPPRNELEVRNLNAGHKRSADEVTAQANRSDCPR